jgi:MFS family permease
VVAPAADDWSLGSVVWIFSVAIVCLGLSAALAGKWLERVGPRLVGLVATLCWCGGFLVGALGIHLHELWLLYLGYGVIGGIGLGLGYVSPVSTLIRWFPDHRGMATGLAIMGFGGGAIIGAPLKTWLLSHFSRAPEFLGSTGALQLVTEQGRQFAVTAAGRIEVVVATAAQAAALPGGGEAGASAVGTGSTGAAATFLVLAALYGVVMGIAAFSYRVPAAGWLPAGWTPPAETASHGMISTHHVHADEAIRTPQFWLLWVVLCMNVSAGIGILGQASPMIQDMFGVSAAAGAGYVGLLSLCNLGGRFFWSSCYDFLGRKVTYCVYFILGAALYLSVPWTQGQGNVTLFVIVTGLILTMYGGGFATIPAYLRDLFGSYQVGAIHGRLITAWSLAAIIGPTLVDRLSVENKKTLPAAQAYNSIFYIMVGLLVVGLIANLLVRPVDAKYHVKN